MRTIEYKTVDDVIDGLKPYLGYKCYVYEGESIGIVIEDINGKQIDFIDCEPNYIDDEGESKEEYCPLMHEVTCQKCGSKFCADINGTVVECDKCGERYFRQYKQNKDDNMTYDFIMFKNATKDWNI